MPMNEAKRTVLASNHDAIELLYRTLPKMHPAALKHEYATSVANAYNHPIAWAHKGEDQDEIAMISFGDLERTKPLVLVYETVPGAEDSVDAAGRPLPPEATSIRHAFAPKVGDDLERRLLVELEHQDRAFAQRHGLTPRNIMREFSHRSRGDISSRGINGFADEYFDEPKWASYRASFYPTRYVPRGREVAPANKSVNINDPDHKARLERNVATMLNDMTVASGQPVHAVAGVRLDQRGKEAGVLEAGHLKLDDIAFSNTTPTGGTPAPRVSVHPTTITKPRTSHEEGVSIIQEVAPIPSLDIPVVTSKKKTEPELDF